MNLTEKKIFRLVISACFMIYTASMVAKTVFTSEMSVIIEFYNTTKTEISLSNTFYFVTYAIVQVILFFQIKRINVIKYLYITTPISAILCFVIPMCPSVKAIWVVFALIGIAQAGIWACCIEIISKNVANAYIPQANKIMNVGFAVGNTASYLLSAFFVKFFNWKITFFVSALLFIICIVFFIIVMRKLRNNRTEKENTTTDEQSNFNNAVFRIDNKKQKVIFYVLASIIAYFCSSMYYTIMNWMVNFLKENFGLSDSFSIFITIGLPILMVLGPILSVNLNQRQRNFVSNILVGSIIPLVISLLMIFIYNLNIYVSVILLIVYIILARMLNTTYASIVGLNMRGEIDSGGYCALVNAVASVGAGVSPVIAGNLIDSFGWKSQFIITSVYIVIVILFCLISNYLISKKNKGEISD